MPGEMPVVELEPFPVVSADATASGLSLPFSGGQVASGGRVGLLGSLDYMETPYTITSFTSDLIEDQQAASVGEVLLNDPAVRVARGFGNFQQVYMVRGLPVFSDDMAYNGLYGLLPRQYLGAEIIERVEVFRGANAFLNGAAPGGSGLGGAVNVMPKRASNEPTADITFGIQTGGQYYVAADVGERFSDMRFGVRANGALRDGDTAIDGESSSLQIFAIGLDYHGEKFRISSDIGYQDLQLDASQPSVTISAGLEIPDAPEADKSFAQPWTFSDARDVFGTVRAEFDAAEFLTVWAAGGFREGEERNRLSNPTVVDDAGTTSSYRFDNVRKDSVRTGEIGVRSEFVTGPADHRLTLAATLFELDSDNAYAFSDFAGFSSSIYDPVAVTPPLADYFVGGDLANPLKTEATETLSFAIADIISLDNRLYLIGGLRYQEIEAHTFDYNTGAEISSYSDNAVTPTVGVLYRITKQLSAYANYIEGLTKGDVAPANSGGTPVVNAGEALEPYVTEQVEFGVKFDLGRLGGSVNVFQSEKPVAGVSPEGVFSVIDDQRNRGLELSLYGEPISGWKVLGGVNFIDSDLNGAESIGAPTVQLNLGTEVRIPWVNELYADARIIHTSEQYADAANTQEAPDWTRFDLGIRYVFMINGEPGVTVRARVENVFDEDYWASAGGYPGAGYLTLGAPRTFILSATYAF